MRDDQVVVGIDRDLHVVANHARATVARRHRAAVGIGERDLLIGRGQHQLFHRRARFASGRRDQGTPEENKAIVQGSLAYCGTYAVSNETLIMRIEGSTYPNEEGVEQRRAYTLNG